MLVREARFLKGAAGWAGMPNDGMPEVAFIGRSNVGKSSLINMLVGRKSLALTSGNPGKTREFNFYVVNDVVYLVDLPGFGYAKVSQAERDRWAVLIMRYLNERAPLRVVFHLVDSRHGLTGLDQEVVAMMKGAPVPYVILLTKSDKLSGNGRNKSKAQVEKALLDRGMEVPVIPTSAETKLGLDAVWKWIDEVGMLPMAG